MKKVTFANTNAETKEVNVHFSLGYFFFGPIYDLCKGLIVKGVLLLVVYLAIIFPGAVSLIKDILVNFGVGEDKLEFFDKLPGLYWWLIAALGVLHIIVTLITPRFVIKKLLKRGFVPYCEIDTQILIKHNLVKVGTLCYLSSFKAIDGVQGKIKMGNSKNLEKELEELKELLKEGMITKDEYETKRAMAIMRSGKK